MAIQIGQKLNSKEAFELAIFEARKGLGFVAPNPPVGCVILDKEDRLLAVGHHQKFGGAHAEVNAVQSVKDPEKLKGAKVFVTLEPCSHFGKTPPCADLLCGLPVSEVHFGVKDPNPKVSGRGLEKIQSAGIQIVSAPESVQEELQNLIRVFWVNQTEQRCFVALKVASTLDAQMALPNGESQWITGTEARTQGHILRAHYGSILTTAKSVLRDNSSLNARVEPFNEKEIPVFVLDPEGSLASTLKNLNLSKVRRPESLFVITTGAQASRFEGVMASEQICKMETPQGQFSLKEVLQWVWDRGGASVMVEAGPNLISQFVSAKTFDQLELFLAPQIFGVASEMSWSQSLGLTKMSQALKFQKVSYQPLGQDLWISATHRSNFSQ
ncbi:MAG TPA: bifunctional diaminohydroxyphosphoribosylaminopyrimidine deaminase/5-amino-6-(5-phosphoribosylamino)uracil reductase RibD [Bdellovibrionales bacterium]|nr:riboflavin biosynthesis protein RibD [Pseudobdellovibrionaceae bacterium]HAG90714.1 bifunctional diaminohydroxyphosphoribosylaminopyrimidine deaminase/5-amino-6-(5-phosphoribosylamino)uracil reductase RibD [Bdellovibrionales bacterium]|tara:strand:- start:971 stop:2122 length:1152 start_codon:yes stop_codon:yes gene_type:complete